MLLELPAVSIIVYAYGGIKYLPATINSILQQTYTNFEVLVFDRGHSLTASWFERRDLRLKFFSSINQGISETFNQGILAAKGKYITFINAGDLWHPTKLQKQIFCLDQNPELGLTYSWVMPIIDQNKSQEKIIKYQHSVKTKFQTESQNKAWLLSVMVRRSCFNGVGLFDLQLEAIPGWDLWLRLSHRYQFREISETLVYWRKDKSSLTKNWRILEKDLQIIIEKADLNYAPEQLQLKLKYQRYADASLFLADLVLNNQQPDISIAHNYCQQALQHYPLIGLSPRFMKVGLTITLLRCLKSDLYISILPLVQMVSSLLKETTSVVKEYTQDLLDWMLKEEDIIFFGKNSNVEGQGED